MIEEIMFVVGSAKVIIPMNSFEDAAVAQKMKDEQCNDFIVTLSIKEIEIDNVVSLEYGMCIALDKENEIDVTAMIPGAQLLQD